MKLAVSSEKIKMTYSSIFARSFSRSEKKLGYGATGSLLMAFSIWIVFKHYLCQVSVCKFHFQLVRRLKMDPISCK